ncbi:MAG: MFS transporter [Acidobacteria bacterium]|nr:MFS transporter [Acidobacteriota bacterium]
MTPQQVIRNYRAIAGLYTLSASLIWGVNTLFLLEAGLDILEVFIANATFTASMALFEIPTGVVADTVGRRVSFLVSVVIVFAGTLGYVAASAAGGGLFLFCAVSVLLGLGYTFYSGAVEAWLVDALRATGFDGQLDRVFARGSMVTGAAMLVGTLGGGVLGSLNLAFPFLLRALLMMIVFGLAWRTMHDLGFTPRTFRFSALPAEMQSVGRASMIYGWQKRSVRLLMIASFFQWGFLSWGFYAWQPYFLDLLGHDAVWVAGVIAALIALSTIAGNTLVERLARYCGRRTTLLLWAAAIQTGAAIGVGLAGSFWLAVALLLVVTSCMGVTVPVKQAYLHQVVPSEKRATVISFASMIGGGGSVAGQVGLGYLARVHSIPLGYIVGGLFTLGVLPVLGSLRALSEPADVIIGTAGRKGSCAAQGLPSVTSLDTTPANPPGAGSHEMRSLDS